jgi:sterol desaturase/sphingolipid hydroxylase (fatty acid hydroxylase superfamily)
METLIRDPWFISGVILLTVLEAIWRFRSGKGYDVKGAAASFGVAAGNFATKPLNAIIIGGTFVWLASLTPLKLPMDDWRVWALGFIGVEFCYYWFHRWSHLVRWMWASHAVHHTAQEMTFPAAIRLGWTGAISGGWICFAPLILLGFHPAMVATLLGFNLAFQFLLHTESVGRLGPLEWVFNTPSHHRVHHACNDDYLDKNFGGVLIVFDRMFGTFAEETREVPLRYGLTTGFSSRNPLEIALQEWGAMFKDVRIAQKGRVIAVLFGRPGEGSSPIAAQPDGAEVDGFRAEQAAQLAPTGTRP